ncbi:MAG: diaminopimelate decarboxylase [Dehalococcoidia bacterium]
MSFTNKELFPMNVGINADDCLTLGGLDVSDLTKEFGTPLYVYDEGTIRAMCREFVEEFSSRYKNSLVAYASKAFINPAIASLINDESMGLDVVSGGEIAVAKAVGFPPEKIYFHGNNKTPDEIEFALDYGIGHFVVDSFSELQILEEISSNKGIKQDILLRVSPGVDPHTHHLTTTGITDSKFGFSIETGDASHAIQTALKSNDLDLKGIHFHLGSPIFELEPYSQGVGVVLDFLQQFQKDGLDLREFSPGGGFAIGYVKEQLPPSIGEYADVIVESVIEGCSRNGFSLPKIVVEPGRSITGRAGVALYTVGAIKEIPTVRKYVSLDGGMGDNIRPALYDAKYEAVLANRMSEPPQEVVTLAGKFCESGDVLIKDILLPELISGDIVALPSSGAYAPSMASNYNLNPRPPIVMVDNGKIRLIRRRETYQDLMLCDQI